MPDKSTLRTTVNHEAEQRRETEEIKPTEGKERKMSQEVEEKAPEATTEDQQQTARRKRGLRRFFSVSF